jgi:hypothetical protein
MGGRKAELGDLGEVQLFFRQGESRMKTRKYRVCVVDRQKKIDKEKEKDRTGFG